MKLKEGESICPVCNGKGKYPSVNEKGIIRCYNACPKCLGTGKLDWVELVVGKRVPNLYDSKTLPFLRTYYPKLIAKDLVSIQPMITYGLKVKYGTTKRRRINMSSM